MADRFTAQELAAAVGQTLPADYLAFLDGLPTRPTLGPRYGPILDFGGRRWRPYSLGRLAEAVPCRKRETPTPYAHQMAKAAVDLRAGDAAAGEAVSAELGAKGFSIDRLAHGFCIGDDGNGAPVFVDAASGGVYAFYHDGLDVEPWARSVAELVAGSRDWLGDDATEPAAAADRSLDRK